jgi:hypothetical protein
MTCLDHGFLRVAWEGEVVFFRNELRFLLIGIGWKKDKRVEGISRGISCFNIQLR